jgi:hypothetical protein
MKSINHQWHQREEIMKITEMAKSKICRRNGNGENIWQWRKAASIEMAIMKMANQRK